MGNLHPSCSSKLEKLQVTVYTRDPQPTAHGRAMACSKPGCASDEQVNTCIWRSTYVSGAQAHAAPLAQVVGPCTCMRSSTCTSGASHISKCMLLMQVELCMWAQGPSACVWSSISVSGGGTYAPVTPMELCTCTCHSHTRGTQAGPPRWKGWGPLNLLMKQKLSVHYSDSGFSWKGWNLVDACGKAPK